MIYPIDLANHYQMLQFLELQQLGYRKEAEIIGFQEMPPLFESFQTLKASGELFYGDYYLSNQEHTDAKAEWYVSNPEQFSLRGAIAFKVDQEVITIRRLMVHPDYYRQGIASNLLAAVHALYQHDAMFHVSTTSLNVPAIFFYRKHGYREVHSHALTPDITLISFQRHRISYM